MFPFFYSFSWYISPDCNFHPKCSNDRTTHEKVYFQFDLCRAVLSAFTIRKLIKTQIIYPSKLIRHFMTRDKVLMFMSPIFPSHSVKTKSKIERLSSTHQWKWWHTPGIRSRKRKNWSWCADVSKTRIFIHSQNIYTFINKISDIFSWLRSKALGQNETHWARFLAVFQGNKRAWASSTCTISFGCF